MAINGGVIYFGEARSRDLDYNYKKRNEWPFKSRRCFDLLATLKLLDVKIWILETKWVKIKDICASSLDIGF